VIWETLGANAGIIFAPVVHRFFHKLHRRHQLADVSNTKDINADR
jgi:hypothetical protein